VQFEWDEDCPPIDCNQYDETCTSEYMLAYWGSASYFWVILFMAAFMAKETSGVRLASVRTHTEAVRHRGSQTQRQSDTGTVRHRASQTHGAVTHRGSQTHGAVTHRGSQIQRQSDTMTVTHRQSDTDCCHSQQCKCLMTLSDQKGR
jgi:hypothetical protein